jgi:Mo-co oxidoreductase dimerisation domain
VAVDVGVDGVWAPAQLDDTLGTHAWRDWSFTWDAEAGEHELTCRATDAAGNSQPLETPWNHQGMGTNAVQRTRVTVHDPRRNTV